MNPTSPYIDVLIVFIHHVFLLQIPAFKDEQLQEQVLLLELLHFQCWMPFSRLHLPNMGAEEGWLWPKMRSRIQGRKIHVANSCSLSFGELSCTEHGCLCSQLEKSWSLCLQKELVPLQLSWWAVPATGSGFAALRATHSAVKVT